LTNIADGPFFKNACSCASLSRNHDPNSAEWVRSRVPLTNPRSSPLVLLRRQNDMRPEARSVLAHMPGVVFGLRERGKFEQVLRPFPLNVG